MDRENNPVTTAIKVCTTVVTILFLTLVPGAAPSNTTNNQDTPREQERVIEVTRDKTDGNPRGFPITTANIFDAVCAEIGPITSDRLKEAISGIELEPSATTITFTIRDNAIIDGPGYRYTQLSESDANYSAEQMARTTVEMPRDEHRLVVSTVEQSGLRNVREFSLYDLRDVRHYSTPEKLTVVLDFSDGNPNPPNWNVSFEYGLVQREEGIRLVEAFAKDRNYTHDEMRRTTFGLEPGTDTMILTTDLPDGRKWAERIDLRGNVSGWRGGGPVNMEIRDSGGVTRNYAFTFGTDAEQRKRATAFNDMLFSTLDRLHPFDPSLLNHPERAPINPWPISSNTDANPTKNLFARHGAGNGHKSHPENRFRNAAFDPGQIARARNGLHA